MTKENQYREGKDFQNYFIHRCYMTGQKCVYLRTLLGSEQAGAFVLCPFDSDFNHIFKYYLINLDMSTIGVSGEVRRADSVGRTGYVMCSRICFPIQQSAVIIADITSPNLNVFYELGLACALEKKLVLLAHKDLTPAYILKFVKSVGLDSHLVHYSAGLNEIGDQIFQNCRPVKSFRLDGMSGVPNPNMRVPIFSNECMNYLKLGEQQPLVGREIVISHTIKEILTRLKSQERIKSIIERCHILLEDKGDPKRSIILRGKFIEEYITALLDGIYCVHEHIGSLSPVKAIGQADFVLIDTSLEDFETYFWFGLCHGLLKEVIPLSITDERISEISLPFDIRTLWHVYGSFSEPLNINEQLEQILIEVIAKLIDTKAVANREYFWRDIIHSSKLSFYLGTEQSKHLASKQVMGEWDLRTFQEISSFTSRSNPNLDISIEKPVFRRDEYKDEERNAFKELLRQRMGNSHCIIIGTPDVNPVAEMVLSELKGIKPFVTWYRDNTVRNNSDSFPKLPSRGIEGYIAFKNYLYDYYPPQLISFFLQFNSKKPERGFVFYDEKGIHKDQYIEEYIPREKCEPNPKVPDYRRWNLLGHFVVVPNPFSKGFPGVKYKVILIMGVGGPATLGLAHLLTGRPPECLFEEWTEGGIAEFIKTSERFLGKFNELLAKNHSAEAIVKIEVLNNLASANNEFEDSREIQRIEVVPSLPGVDNPKPFVWA